MPTVSKWQTRLLLGFALGGIVFVAGCLFADFDKLINAFSLFSWPYLLAGLLLAYLNYLIRFIKFDYYLRLLDIHISKREGLSIFLSGLVLTITPGKLGEVLKSFLIKQVTGDPVARTAPIVVAERLTDFIAMIVLSLGGILSVKYGLKVIIISLVCLGIFFILIGIPRVAVAIINLIRGVPRLKNLGDKLLDAYKSTQLLIAFRPLIVGTLISIPAWFLECLAFYIIILGFGAEVSLMYATFAYALSTIIGALSMLPGGLGPTEGGLVGLLLSVDILKSVAVAATFLVRVATLWFAVLVGAIALILRHQRISELNEVFAAAEPEVDPAPHKRP